MKEPAMGEERYQKCSEKKEHFSKRPATEDLLAAGSFGVLVI